jgi:hypothetical protein
MIEKVRAMRDAYLTGDGNTISRTDKYLAANEVLAAFADDGESVRS